MWSLLPRRLQLLSIVIPTIVIVLATDAAIEIAGGEKTNPLKHASLVVFVIGAMLAPLANSLWRHIWRWIPAIESAIFPDLNGTWEGSILTTWTDPKTGKSTSPIPATVWIKQSLFSTKLRLRTGE